MPKALILSLLACCIFTCSGCEASTKPDLAFPVITVVPEGDQLEYQSGDIDRIWVAGDTITFDFDNGTIYVNGLVHYPHPWVMKDENELATRYKSCPYVLENLDDNVAYPWNHAVALYEDYRSATTRAAEEKYVETHSTEAARDILRDSGLFENVTITTISGIPALSYFDIGVVNPDGTPTYLPLQDPLPPAAGGPLPLTLHQASDMVRKILVGFSNSRVSSTIILREGNVEGHLGQGRR